MSLPTVSREYYYPSPGAPLATRERAVPAPRASEVLVAIHAVSLQYRDLMVSRNQYPAQLRDGLVPCSDGAGAIVAVGADVRGWAPGDRVCANFALDHVHGDLTPAIQATGLGAQVDGVLTQYRAFPAHALVRVPEHLSYEEAATLPCAALTAYNALRGPTPLKGGDTVLVQGTGGVSIFALQLAVASGATVIATSSSDEKLKIASKLGAAHVINYTTTPNWDDEVLRLTHGRGVDHVIEVGGPGTLARSSRAVRFAGWVHIIGVVAQAAAPPDVVRTLIGRAIILRGIQIGSVAQFKDMNRLIAAHGLRPVVDRVFAFAEARAAYAHLASQTHVGKVVIRVVEE